MTHVKHMLKLHAQKLQWVVPGMTNTCRSRPCSSLVPTCHPDLLPFQKLKGNLVSLQALEPCHWQLKYIHQYNG
jgi:hypothetical protein